MFTVGDIFIIFGGLLFLLGTFLIISRFIVRFFGRD
jgi:hypothetical protein